MKDRLQKVIDAIDKMYPPGEDSRKKSWAYNFCTSLFDQVDRGRKLSDRQIEIFEKHEKEHSEEAIAEKNQWKKKWASNKDLRETFLICAKYYCNTGYYRDVCRTSLEDDRAILEGKYVPTLKIFKSMTGNKYAQKVLQSWYSEARYSAGETVAIRTNAPRAAFQSVRLPVHKDGMCIPYFILEVNSETPWSASKGSKVYRILPVGDSTSFLVEERAIKKYKRKKKQG